MGFFGGIAKMAKGVVSVADKVLDSPIGRVASAVPFVGGAVDLASDVIGGADDYLNPSGGGSPAAEALPPPPAGFGGAVGMPAAPSVGRAPSMPSGTLPARPGAAGPEWYPVTQAKVVRRCAPGYVKVDTVIDGNAVRVCMRKDAARARRLWKPARKPPISVKEANAIRNADRAIKKFQRFEKKAKSIANWRAPSRSRSKAIPASYTVIDEGSGSANLKMISTGRKK